MCGLAPSQPSPNIGEGVQGQEPATPHVAVVSPTRRRWLLALAALPLLVACGRGPRRRMGIREPRVTLAGIEREPAGWQVRVRIQNVIDRDIVLAGIDLQLHCGPASSSLRLSGQAMRIPSLASEVVTIPTALSSAFVNALETAATRSGGAAYRLEGQVESSEPSRRFKVEYAGFLSPVPGRDGAYR